jgi:serine/threonine-protein kinase
MPGPPQAAEPELGERLGPYRLEAVLGEGGMGVVYRAARDPGGELVALKVLRRELSGDDTYRRRFERECRIAAGITHKHLVRVIGSGESDGRPYLATEYIAGRTLAEQLAAEGPLQVPAALRLTAELATGLDTLHGEGLVHRDVKPTNVIVASTGLAYLTDFGVARSAAATVLTKPGHVVGTLEYLAPEVIQGSTAGPAADIYSLGCVAYECLVGSPPHAGQGFVETTLAILEADPEDPGALRPELPAELSSVLLQALAKQPSARPPTATAYALMLRISARAA